MVILHVHDSLGFAGGAEQYLFNVASELAKAGHTNYLMYLEASGSACQEFAGPFKEIYQYLEAAAESTLPKIDIVYVHKWNLPFERVKSALGSSCPTFQFIHDHDLLCLRTHKSFYFSGNACYFPIGLRCLGCLPFSPKVRNWSLSQMINPLHTQKESLVALQEHTAIVVGSTYLQEQFSRNGFASEHVLVNPLFTDYVPAFHSFPQDEIPSLLYVGRLDRGKGLDLLLASLAKVKKRFRLFVVGEGKSRKEFTRFAQQYRLDNSVKFLGPVAHSALPPLYEAARMVIIPSRSPETFGLAAIEAMAHGRPPVAFRVGALREVIEHGQDGLLAEEQDLAGLAHHIDCLLEDAELAAALGKAGVEKVKNFYGPSRHVQRLVDVFNAALARRISGLPGSQLCFA